ncbi:MAG: O-antigen ligase family protein [Bryobacteraceae bacterium]
MSVQRAAGLLLWLFVFSLPWEKSLIVPGVGTAARLLGGLALAAGVGVAIRRKSVRGPNLVLALAAAFAMWAAATYFWSLAPSATAARAWTYAQLLAMAWLIWDQCRDAGRPVQLMEAYVWGAAVASVATLERFAENQQTNYRRYAAAGFDPNDLALTVALSIPMALYLSGRARGAKAWMYRAAALAAIAAILLTASRTALVAAAAGFVFVPLTWRESDRWQRISSVALLGLLLGGALWLAPAVSRARLASLGDAGTLHNRTRIWKAGLRALESHAALGVGAGAYAEAVGPWLGRPALAGHEYVAHDTFLSILVECGAVGFGLFVALAGAMALFVWMMPPAERALWTAMLAAWAIGVSTLSWEQRKPGWLMLALITAQWAPSFREPEGRA